MLDDRLVIRKEPSGQITHSLPFSPSSLRIVVVGIATEHFSVTARKLDYLDAYGASRMDSQISGIRLDVNHPAILSSFSFPPSWTL